LVDLVSMHQPGGSRHLKVGARRGATSRAAADVPAAPATAPSTRRLARAVPRALVARTRRPRTTPRPHREHHHHEGDPMIDDGRYGTSPPTAVRSIVEGSPHAGFAGYSTSGRG